MTEETRYTEQEFHKKMGVDLFNGTWDFLDKTERTPDEDLQMVHMAHASRYHWGQVGTPLNFERGEWQISRVYAVLNRAEPALFHAQKCLEICQEHSYGDFDLAFAYEAVARAHAIAGNVAERDEHLKLAQEAGAQIAKEGDKEYFISELGTI